MRRRAVARGTVSSASESPCFPDRNASTRPSEELKKREIFYVRFQLTTTTTNQPEASQIASPRKGKFQTTPRPANRIPTWIPIIRTARHRYRTS